MRLSDDLFLLSRTQFKYILTIIFIRKPAQKMHLKITLTTLIIFSFFSLCRRPSLGIQERKREREKEREKERKKERKSLLMMIRIW
jgi:hypothetical protein